MLNNYCISDNTLAVIALDASCCMVYEIGSTFKINMSIKQILDFSCNFYGSSLKGRMEGSKHILNMKYKLPIIVNQYKNLIFFSTRSYTDNNTYIINYNNIDYYEKSGKDTDIYFKNNIKIKLNDSYNVFKNQYINADLLYRKAENIKNAS